VFLSSPIKLLITLCVTLLMVICLEWLLFNLAFTGNPLTIKPRAGIEAKPLIPKSLSLIKKNYADVTKNPLFIEGRKPVERRVASTTNSPKTKQPNKSFKLTLAGISLYENQSLALLQDRRGKYHRLLIGEKLEGWTLKSIQQRSVTLHSSGKIKLIKLKKYKKTDNSKAQPDIPLKEERKLGIKKLPLHRGHK